MADTIDLGLVTAYGNAKEGGYTGTESQFNTLLANLPTYASNAAASATAAASSAADANDAADRAEQIVGGQFVSYGQTQGLSDAQQEQARANISAGASNRNQLDNPWFTVNQRSATTVKLNGTEAYIADRWIAGSFGTYTHNSDNTITITCPNSTAFAGLTQRIDPVYKGGTYTYSIRLSDDTVISLQGTMPSGSGLNVYNITINGTAWQVLFRSDSSAYWITLRCNVANTTVTVKAIKLELGSYSTLANDVPPDYEEELRKCMYYFQRIRQKNSYTLCVGFGEAMNSTTNIHITIPTAVPMRHQSSAMSAVPTGTGTMYIVGNGQLLPVTAVSGLGVTGNAVVVNVTVSTAGAYNHIYGLRFTNNSTYIDLSADL